jgi:predicted Na+-dependent transporter
VDPTPIGKNKMSGFWPNFFLHLFTNVWRRWCSLFNADLALSVTMTAISTVVSIVALPMNLLLYANVCYHVDVTSDLDWVSVFVALAIVISGISLGLFCSYYCHSHQFNIMANQGWFSSVEQRKLLSFI